MMFGFVRRIVNRIRTAASGYLRRLLRDVRFLSGLVPALLEIKSVARSASSRSGGRWSAASFWDRTVERHGDRPALVFVGGGDGDGGGATTLTFAQVDRLSNRCGRAALRLGLRPGGEDAAAILMENRPEYVLLVLGLAKVGVSAALLNANLSGAGLARCIRACGARTVLFSRETAAAVGTLPEDGDEAMAGVSFAYVGAETDVPTEWETILGRRCEALDYAGASDAPIPPGLREDVKFTDTMLHIFTSGTTGLPKAARINHLRYFGSSLIFSRLCRFRPTDRIYCPLPFYHSSAIVLGLGLSWHNGIPLVFRPKFSAGAFWADCAAHGVTVVQYIGELCRYLCAAPHRPEEEGHSVRVALGNGLRPDVWEEFVGRFGIPRVVEFYAATEGNVGLINTEGRVGAIGFLSPLLSRKHPGKILRFDHATGMPYRDDEGRCVECLPGEVGEFVGMINKNDVTQHFDGYSDEAETDKKLLRDVFAVGDECFRSGDLMRKDAEGFIYFIDRIGDTFRWKGENVSTTEVEGVLQACEGVEECVVYGVSVKGCEGKAGMALIRVQDANNLPLSQIHSALTVNLPEYARPVFVRFTGEAIDTTTTFKHQKQRLVSDGFDPNALPCTDKLFFRKSAKKCHYEGASDSGKETSLKRPFVELTTTLHKGILSGEARL